MALAKPVMGTKDPAPAYLPSLSNTPTPVSSAVRNTIVMLVRLEAVRAFMSSQWMPASAMAWPSTQISPPTQKARPSPAPRGDGGESCSVSQE